MKRAIPVVAALLSFLGPVFADEPLRLPAPSSGVIDGFDATYIWPARFRKAGSYDLQPTMNCQVHLSQRRDLNAGSVYPCGKWFIPKAGMHKYWIEGPDFISPEPLVMNWRGGATTGNGRGMVAPVVSSAFVRLAGGTTVAKGDALRLISLETEFFASRAAAFDRPIPDPTRPAAMPHGKILAGIFHLESGDAVALARPVTARAGETVSVSPAPPARDSDVFVVLTRKLEQQGDVRLFLEDEAGRRAPDTALVMRDSVYAVWYGARGKSAALAVESDALMLPAATIPLRHQRVSTYRGALKSKPSLAISVHVPEKVFETMAVAVAGADYKVIARKPIERESSLRLEGMPAEPLRITLSADRWQLTKDVDLSEGEDAEVEFVLEPILVHGTVYVGRDPVRAALRFTDGPREVVSIETDDSGQYEAVFWQSSQYEVAIKPESLSGGAFIDPAVSVDASGTIDFRLPDNRITARVVDARTGRGIGGAIVGVTSESEHQEVGAMTMSRRFTADEEGKLELPRLWAGPASIEAVAPGYAPSEAQTLEVDAATKRELTFSLTALGTLPVRVTLPDGQLAGGAEAAVFLFERQVWRGVAGQDGKLDVGGQGVNGILIVRHPQAASIVRRLANLEERLVLDPADAGLLRLRSVDSSGERVRFALLTVWLDGFRLTDRAAAFATWSDVAMTGSDGMWAARNLPAAPLRVLATRRILPAEIATGAYDALAQVVAFPRPAPVVDIYAVE